MACLPNAKHAGLLIACPSKVRAKVVSHSFINAKLNVGSHAGS
jgi:hypothetical protein